MQRERLETAAAVAAAALNAGDAGTWRSKPAKSPWDLGPSKGPKPRSSTNRGPTRGRDRTAKLLLMRPAAASRANR